MRWPLLIVSILTLTFAGAAFAASLTIKQNNSALGKIVVNSKGLTLYHNTKEIKGLIKCKGSCTSVWPPLIVNKGTKLVAGSGIKTSALSKIKRPDGRFQVTYYHKPLYRYFGDTKSGNIRGEGLGGIWFALKTNGSLAKPLTTQTTTTTSTTIPGY